MSLIQIQKPRYEEQARILETTTYKQVFHKWYDDKGGKCAVGIIEDWANFKGTQRQDSYTHFLPSYCRIVGLPSEIINQIIILNDTYKKSFQEIANWLRTL